MSRYGGRVNVSQFLANLNTYPEEPIVDNYEQTDLSLFTNLQFFDFDMANPSQMTESDGDSNNNDNVSRQKQQTFSHDITKENSNANAILDEADALNFIDFANYDFSQALPLTDLDQPSSSNQTASMMSLVSQDSSPFSPNSSVASPPKAPTSYNATSPTATHQNSQSHSHIITGKRKSIVLEASPEELLEDASRFAAEEDKRRRNTAASARFRIKKKQREQALEQTAKEMTEKVGEMQARINQLEMENKWLKNLITEKNSKSGSVFDISEIFNAKFSAAAAAAAAAGASNVGAGSTATPTISSKNGSSGSSAIKASEPAVPSEHTKPELSKV